MGTRNWRLCYQLSCRYYPGSPHWIDISIIDTVHRADDDDAAVKPRPQPALEVLQEGELRPLRRLLQHQYWYRVLQWYWYRVCIDQKRTYKYSSCTVLITVLQNLRNLNFKLPK